VYDEPRRADAADPTAAATSASPAAFDAADKRYPTATRLATPAEITIASVGAMRCATYGHQHRCGPRSSPPAA